MKKTFKMSIYFIFFFVLFFGFSSEVDAATIVKECIYQYDVAGSEHVSALKFRILDNGKATSIVTSYNGKNQNNLERNTNWNDDMNDTFNKNKECPKYAMVAKKWNGLHVFVSYTEQALKDIANDKKYSDYFIEPLISSNNSGTLTDHVGGNDNIYTSEEIEDIQDGTDNEETNKVTGSGEGCDALGPLLDDIKFAWNLIKIAAPILVIVFGSVDFAQAVISSDEKVYKNAINKFSKRLMFAVALFFLPYLVDLLLTISGINQGIESAICGIK